MGSINIKDTIWGQETCITSKKIGKPTSPSKNWQGIFRNPPTLGRLSNQQHCSLRRVKGLLFYLFYPLKHLRTVFFFEKLIPALMGRNVKSTIANSKCRFSKNTRHQQRARCEKAGACGNRHVGDVAGLQA